MSAGNDPFGRALPTIRTAIPGPESRRHAARLSRVESRNITRLWPLPPIFWAAAAGANVEDVDGNIFIDLTAGFGVATAGHANPAVTAAIAEQARKLPHGLGDVHPSKIKVELLEAFGEIAPAALRVGILGSAGAEAVEAALKTALLRTARAGVLAFECSYHGLTYGALATTHRIEFRAPFLAQLFDGVQFAPFPTRAVDLASALSVVDEILEKSSPQIGAILVEPIQGRGGIRMPCDGFLAALRERCDGETRVLIFDEIYTGMGRTGHWFACQHWGVVPDILVAGKGLSGSLPLSVALGTEEVMSAWPESTGEAIHTSTFLGNPIACAAALAQINEIRSKALLDRAKAIGRILGERLAEWPGRYSIVQDIRGRGALLGIELRISDTPLALVVANRALERGLIVLAEGISAEVIALTPPLVITDEQLGFALDVVEETIARCASA